jgi:predicted CoA-substrate-specific enzyme activase
MIAAGIDVGMGYIKIAILQDGEVVGRAQGISGGARRAEHIRDVWEAALAEAGISAGDVGRVHATGKGKHAAERADALVMEAEAVVKAAVRYCPKATTAVSIGIDETIVATIREDGSIAEFTQNQKCAAGIGIFLENLADRMNMSVEEIAALDGAHAIVNDGCPVFADLDTLSLLNQGVSRERTALAAMDAMAVRASTTINDITVPDLARMVLVGGLAKNAAFVRALEKQTGITFVIPENPEYACAVGVAT